MVGVVLFLIVLLCAGGKAAEICPPKICKCLGDVVDCAGKPLFAVPDNIPSWTTNLYIGNSSIRSLNATVLKRLKNLETLQLKKNKISSIHIDAFSNNLNLTELDISRNAIKIIEPLTFKSLEKLKDLNIRHNNISILKDGTFFGLKHMKTLALDFNYIQKIQKSWLYGMDSLERLLLSNNAISTIEQTAWESVPRLKELNLASNRLSSIKRNTFLKLGSLERLNLNNNNISFLADGAFSNTPKLKTLHLSNNHIHITIEDAIGVFRSLNKLEKFYLASNNIKTIKKNSFAGLQKITHLDLNHNNITFIQKNAFADMSSLKILKLNSTALVCDCNLQWFYNFLKTEERLKIHTHLTCAYPESLERMPFLTVPADNFTCDNFVKPRLIEQPDGEIMALKGMNITLSCKAISSLTNEMIFQWKKDGKDIFRGNINNTSNSQNGKNTESVSSLTLYGVQQVDSGKYQCIVSNSFGTVYSQKCSISVLIYPQFIKMPKNVTAKSGTSVQLDCEAIGEPKPEIAWQKDGGINFPAAKDRRIQVKSDENVLFLLNVKREDMGVYSCIAHNAAGTIVSNATVAVEETPYFSKMMEDREVTLGESVVMKCMAGGNPKPSIQWLKNGEPIHTTERHFFTAEDQLMIIIDAVLKDAGTYQCVLNNSLGVSNASSILIVKPGASYDKSELINNKMGVIIITVCCCAVLTSIVWIVIICQARKRMKPALDSSTIQDPMIIEFTEKVPPFADNISEHSSCKDSGTGDSAKRSNDDLVPDSEYTFIINNVNTVDAPKTMRTASLVYVPADANTSTPLLHTEHTTFPRSTNHDRRLNKPSEEVIIVENCPKEDRNE